MSTKNIRVQQKADTTSNWTSNNPQVLPKEACFDVNERSIKLGDTTAIKAYKDLDYFYHPGDEYLVWGGKNTRGNNHGPYDAAYIKELGNNTNQFAYYPPSQIQIEHSIDGGETWFEAGETDELKTQIVTRCDSIPSSSNYLYAAYVGDFTSNNFASQGRHATKDDMVRFTFTTNGSPYFIIKKVDIFVNYATQNRDRCKIEGLKKSNKDTENWEVLLDDVVISGWSGHNILNMDHTFGYNDNSQYCKLRFTIYSIADLEDYVSADYAYCGATAVQGIYAYGIGNWNLISNYNRYGSLYSIDLYKNAIFLNGISVPKYLEVGKSNVLADGISQYLVTGSSNTINNGWGITAGYSHTIDNATAAATVGWRNNNQANYTIMSGENNIASGRSSLTIGKNNRNTAENGIMGGSYGESTSDYLLTLGNGNATTAHNAAAITKLGQLLLDNISIGEIDGTLPSSYGTSTICIGSGTTTNGTFGISIGDSASGNYGDVAIGQGASASGASVAIGMGAGNSNMVNAVSIGYDSDCGDGGVSIGTYTATTYDKGIAIGCNAKSTATQACQIGEGINSEQSSLQFRNYKLLDSSGKIPTDRISDTITASIAANSRVLAELSQTYNKEKSVYVEYDGDASSNLLYDDKLLLYSFDRFYSQVAISSSDGVVFGVVSALKTTTLFGEIANSTYDIQVSFDGYNIYIINSNQFTNSNYQSKTILKITPLDSVSKQEYVPMSDFSDFTFEAPTVNECLQGTATCIIYYDKNKSNNYGWFVTYFQSDISFNGLVIFADANHEYIQSTELNAATGIKIQLPTNAQYVYVFTKITEGTLGSFSPSHLFLFDSYEGIIYGYSSGSASSYQTFNQLDSYVSFTYTAE